MDKMVTNITRARTIGRIVYDEGDPENNVVPQQIVLRVSTSAVADANQRMMAMVDENDEDDSPMFDAEDEDEEKMPEPYTAALCIDFEICDLTPSSIATMTYYFRDDYKNHKSGFRQAQDTMEALEDDTVIKMVNESRQEIAQAIAGNLH